MKSQGTKLKLETIIENTKNLAEILDENTLISIGNDVVEGYETDNLS